LRGKLSSIPGVLFNKTKRLILDLSLFYKMFYGIILITLSIIIFFSSISFVYIRNTNIHNAEQSASRLVNNINLAFGDNLNQIDNIISSITADTTAQNEGGPSMQEILYTSNFKNVMDEYQSMNVVKNFFQQLIFLRKDFNSIYIYVSPKKSFSYAILGSNKMSYEPEHEEWFKKAVAANGSTVISQPHLPYQLTSSCQVISFSRLLKGSILYRKYSDLNPVILIDVKIDTIKSIIKQANVSENTGVMFCNKSGNIIYTNNFQDNISNLGKDVTNQIMKNDSGELTAVINGEKYLLTFGTSNITGWKLITTTPYSIIQNDLTKMLLFDLIILLMVVFFTILISYLFSKMIFKPIKKLQTGMSLVKSGKFEFQLEANTNDELGQLVGDFNSMTTTINNLINEKYVAEIARKSAEFSYLQAQINPHFIYNTLQTISSMAVVYKVPEISTASKGLANTLRYSINTKNKFVTIKDEIDNLISYLEIQKLRFGDSLNYELEVDKEIYNYTIIKLLLQPIAENSITHGIDPKGIKGEIVISGGRVNENVFISIWDNGAGMSEDEVENLMKNINSTKDDIYGFFHDQHNNIGLKNINMRIKMLYGEDFGLEIESQKDDWTRIIIKIPAERAGD